MKAFYNIHQKRKPALLLLAVVLIILCCSFLESRLMQDMNASVTSIYRDRLVPAGSLFHINDLMYTKRTLLVNHLQQPDKSVSTQLQQQLAAQNKQIDSIMKVYENTHLVAEERQTFAAFKANMRELRNLESTLLAARAKGVPTEAGERPLLQLFDQIHQELVLLSDIQTNVGQELLEGTRTINGSAIIISSLQIAVVLIIAVAVYHILLIDTHPLVPKDLKNFRLN